MMHVYVDAQLPIVASMLHDVCNVEVFDARNPPTDLASKNTQAMFVRSTLKVDSNLLDGSNVRFVATATAGLDHLDLSWLSSRNITAVSAPGCNANAVAEYVMLMLQELNQPHPSTLGIIGYGNIGKRLAHHAIAAGYTVIVHDAPLHDKGEHMPHDSALLADLMSQCDAISLHVPLTISGAHPTVGMLSAHYLDMTKHGALLINTSRGEAIDESYLTRMMHTGRMRAALDVFRNEPQINIATIASAEISTPHIAGYTYTAKMNAARMVVRAFAEWSSIPIDQEPQNISADGNYRSPLQDTAEFREIIATVAIHTAFDDFRKNYALVDERLHDPISLQ